MDNNITSTELPIESARILSRVIVKRIVINLAVGVVAVVATELVTHALEKKFASNDDVFQN